MSGELFLRENLGELLQTSLSNCYFYETTALKYAIVIQYTSDLCSLYKLPQLNMHYKMQYVHIDLIIYLFYDPLG